MIGQNNVFVIRIRLNVVRLSFYTATPKRISTIGDEGMLIIQCHKENLIIS